MAVRAAVNIIRDKKKNMLVFYFFFRVDFILLFFFKSVEQYLCVGVVCNKKYGSSVVAGLVISKSVSYWSICHVLSGRVAATVFLFITATPPTVQKFIKIKIYKRRLILCKFGMRPWVL